MGTRSDVAVCIKQKHLAGVPAKVSELCGNADRALESTVGVMYLFTDVKWYTDSDEHIVALYAWLKTLDSEDFLVKEACHDYPESEESDLGQWYDNPWNVYRNISVSLSFDE